jgi:hypothetical protein
VLKESKCRNTWNLEDLVPRRVRKMRGNISLFFLEYVGELYIVILRKNDCFVTMRVNQPHAHGATTPKDYTEDRQSKPFWG